MGETGDLIEGAQANSCLDFRYFVVGLVDLLGQRDELRRWNQLPQSQVEQTQFLSAVKKTVGEVLFWREEFKKIFNLWTRESRLPDEILRKLPDGGEKYRRFGDSKIDTMLFSDTIVAYSPVVNIYGFLNLHAVLGMVMTMGTLLLAAMSDKRRTFRGSIAFGTGCVLPEKDFYGFALADAHSLESEVAQYPRVVISNDTIHYLRLNLDNPHGDPAALANRDLARLVLDRIRQDCDGQWIVDYLNASWATAAPDASKWNTMKESARKFVASELDRFALQGNKKLQCRYKSLLNYFDMSGVSNK